MAHFAELDVNNIVLQIVVVSNQILEKENEEQSGLDFLNSILPNKKFVQTSYNGNMRGKYAAIGDFYDENLNEFVGPIIEMDLLP